jgi:predicted enzyme related to lactoylglutathione lyase
MAKNQVCHIEWKVKDLGRAQEFYAGLFGWSFQQFGDEMVVFGVGNEHIGGLSKADNVEAGTSPSVWFEADDVSAYLAKAKELGGSVNAEKGPVPGVGWSAVATDPDGNHIGLVQFDRS